MTQFRQLTWTAEPLIREEGKFWAGYLLWSARGYGGGRMEKTGIFTSYEAAEKAMTLAALLAAKPRKV